MPKPSFEALTQQLLDAGIAPRFAERLRRELEDHYRDLEREALASERSVLAAELEARRRLGSSELIAREFMSRPELKSWVYRSRWFARFLRGVCFVYIGLRGAVRAVAACRAGLVRFAAASVAAAVITAALLLGPQRRRRARGWDPRVRGGRLSAPETAPETGAALAQESDSPLPREVVRPGFVPPEISLPALPTAELSVRPLVAVELEATPAMLRMTPVDADLLPIIRVAPQFPRMAAARGIEGYVLIEYTVTRTGSVSDIVVIESSSELFERPALEAVEKFKYRPRIVDGSPVPVRGVRARMRFVLEA